MNMLTNGISLLTANVTLYKWLLGGGIVLMALLGLVFFGMLALQVLQQEDATPTEESPAETPATETAEEQEGGHEENS